MVAIEAPLEIRVAGRPLAVTLRTPGHDVELALGFLLAEGVIEARCDVARWLLQAVPSPDTLRSPTGETVTDPRTGTAVVEVDLQDAALERWARRRVAREFRSNSACGACGKPSLEDLYIRPRRAGGEDASAGSRRLAIDEIGGLIDRAAPMQHLFRATGAVHGAAAFDPSGDCLAVFEDVGRHNALDKLIGWSLLGRPAAPAPGQSQEATPATDNGGQLLDDLLVLSTGRAGFEILQKALRARAAGVVVLGAATDWAVELAQDAGMPLIGFGAGEPIRYC